MTRHKPTPDDPEPNTPPGDGAPDPAADAAEQPAAGSVEAPPEQPRAPGEAELRAELADTKDRLLRALAETENLRRRSMRDLQDAHKYAITNFARELLEVADNLSRALEAVPARARDDIEFVKNLADGIAMTEKALLTSFERHQIEKVTPAIGEKFDHNRHQAMFEVESTEQPSCSPATPSRSGCCGRRWSRSPRVGRARPRVPTAGRSAPPEAGAGLRPGRASGSTLLLKPRAAELASGCAPAAPRPHMRARGAR
jgi:molecular chaperone GrpE